jgi:TolA-binding protein
MYLLGELNRKLGNYAEALQWFSKTIVSVNSSHKVKELARVGRDLIKEENI